MNIYIHIHKYINTACSVCKILIAGVFSVLIIWYWINWLTGALIPGKDNFSYSHSLVAWSSLCRTEAFVLSPSLLACLSVVRFYVSSSESKTEVPKLCIECKWAPTFPL